MFGFLFIVFRLCVYVAASTNGEWEIAVSKGNLVELLTSKGETIATLGLELIHATAFAFDNVHTDLYISGVSPKNVSIFRKHINKQGGSFPLQPIVSKSTDYYIQGLAYDPVTFTLFWTTGPGRTIMSANLNENKTELAQESVLHKFVDELPYGIAVDTCNRTLYWTNCNIGKPTIGRSSLEGKERIVIVEKELFKPMAVTISKGPDRYLYWVDEKGYYFTIERCALDGSQRQKIIRSEHQQPSSLAVVGNRLYWTDTVANSVWSVFNYSAVPLKNYSTDQNAILKGVISVYEDIVLDNSCDNVLLKVVNVSGGICLNGVVTQTGSCLCEAGFTGVNCETSLCHNLCFNGGECTISNSSKPTCKCTHSFAGDRCEIDLCNNKCLNGGQCSISAGVIECICSEGFMGERCQFTDTLCSNFCNQVTYYQHLNSSEAAECRCLIHAAMVAPEQENATMGNRRFISFGYKKWPVWSLGVACLVLLTVCLVLSVKVFRLKGRPRLVRRYQVNPNSVKSSGRSTSGDCEIAIENCCNMNICETPCYEPEFRAPEKNTKSKKEEKCGLLSNMDVQPADTTSNDLF